MKRKKITYCDAILEAITQEMQRDKDIFVYGIGVPDHKKMFGTTAGLLEKFGPKRVLDTPIAEESSIGLGLGAAIGGLRPIYIHIRVDFLILALNQIINMLSSFTYGSGGKLAAPLVIRAVIGRGWGQGFQHSKSLQSIFAHIPGLVVVMPTLPEDAKGLLINSIRSNNPVIFLEHRWLYFQTGDVPVEQFTIPFGRGRILKKGNDLTIVATSWMGVEAKQAAEILSKLNISVEIIDPRSISPLDENIIVESVKKTGRCIIADNDWLNCGFSAEVATRVYQKCYKFLKKPVERIGFAPTPCPTVRNLENYFYPNAGDIVKATEKIFDLKPVDLSNEKFYSHESKFKGPF